MIKKGRDVVFSIAVRDSVRNAPAVKESSVVGIYTYVR